MNQDNVHAKAIKCEKTPFPISTCLKLYRVFQWLPLLNQLNKKDVISENSNMACLPFPITNLKQQLEFLGWEVIKRSNAPPTA